MICLPLEPIVKIEAEDQNSLSSPSVTPPMAPPVIPPTSPHQTDSESSEESSNDSDCSDNSVEEQLVDEYYPPSTNQWKGRKRTQINCVIAGCNQWADYNYRQAKVRSYCFDHRKPEMVFKDLRICDTPNCHKTSSFNYPGYGKRYCSDHRKPKMVDVKHPRCLSPGCLGYPIYNYYHGTGPRYCKDHATPKMVDLCNQRCLQDQCSRMAYFAFPKSKVSRCTEHRLPGQIAKRIPLCTQRSCRRQSKYGLDVPLRCDRHRLSTDQYLIAQARDYDRQQQVKREMMEELEVTLDDELEVSNNPPKALSHHRTLNQTKCRRLFN